WYVKIASDGAQLSAAYSTDGETWTAFGRPADLAGIDDPHIGLFANKSKTAAPVVDATFDWFRVVPDATAEDPGTDDDFDGDVLDGCRWDRVVRWNGDTVSLADGSLVMDTTSGSNYGSNNAPPVENMILQTAP